MKLQAKTRYGVRAVFDLAYHSGGGATQARDVAARDPRADGCAGEVRTRRA